MATRDCVELGDLGPIQDFLQGIDEWMEQDRRRRPDGDPVLHTLGELRRRLVQAIADARRPEFDVSVADYASHEGVSASAIYKRRQRGKLPEARKRGGRVRIQLRPHG